MTKGILKNSSSSIDWPDLDSVSGVFRPVKMATKLLIKLLIILIILSVVEMVVTSLELVSREITEIRYTK